MPARWPLECHHCMSRDTWAQLEKCWALKASDRPQIACIVEELNWQLQSVRRSHGEQSKFQLEARGTHLTATANLAPSRVDNELIALASRRVQF
jgi:hypothetical protein